MSDGIGGRHRRARGLEGLPHEGARVPIVIDRENPETVQSWQFTAICRRPRRRVLAPVRCRFRMDDHQRKPYPKRRALILPSAYHWNRSAMKLDEVADDRETEADAAVRAGRAAVRLAKALEDVRQEIGRDADARIADDDFDVRVDALDADLHDPLFRCELHGGRNEVPHHLLQAVWDA